MPVPDLDRVDEAVRGVLEAKFAARELALANSRSVIRSSANAIRALHRSDFDAAAELITAAGDGLAEAREALADHLDIYYAGFFHDAAKEYAEANLTRALFADEALPSPQELGVEPAAYLNGLGEAVGELRRRLLTHLRTGELVGAEETFAAMEAVQDLLETIDYPDAMTGGLRRTTDTARALIERSRADLTTTVVQERLRSRLEEAAGA